MPEPGVGGGALPPPQYIRDQLTLFKLRRADYPHLLHTTGTSNVFHLPASLYNMCAFVGDLFPYILFKPHVAFEYGN